MVTKLISLRALVSKYVVKDKEGKILEFGEYTG